ncbi:CDC42 small effector protein 2 isoform X1 [Equus przewalskii]|uniref:CDC42 small effector protein 2 isoform X1 n=2 Tax=Equus przewalskii TaxID=9798 RepID=A0ABM4KGI0_EQUPR|nr:CDC42 small effector protein 2 isoform X1 [Equus caballus]XP_023473516.1 CDC42 small effector protein 2 isoform X1 [Equus caballus]XP_023473517.1 CDC42 small effector protein 2 isoform X1 [Equus caballus]
MISAHLSLSCSQLSDAWSDGSALTLARPGASAAPLRAQAPPHRLVREGGASRRRLLPGGGGEGLLRAPPQPRSPSSGASFPARAPAPALGSPLASERLPGRHGSSARRGAGLQGRAHPEAGPGAGPARRRGPPAAPGERAAPRPARARAWAGRAGPGSGERAGERSCGSGGGRSRGAGAEGGSGRSRRPRQRRRLPVIGPESRQQFLYLPGGSETSLCRTRNKERKQSDFSSLN